MISLSDTSVQDAIHRDAQNKLFGGERGSYLFAWGESRRIQSPNHRGLNISSRTAFGHLM